MLNKIKSWFSGLRLWPTIWNIIGVIAILLTLISMASYFGGITANWGVITFAIAGLWLYQKFGDKVIITIGTSLWYAGIYTIGFLTIYTYGASTLLGMYDNWADFNRSFWGFVRIFAPIIALVIGSIMIAAVATKPKALSKKFVWACFILACLGLMLHELVEPFDKWSAVKKIEKAQDLNKDRLTSIKGLGMVAEITGPDIKVYKQDEKSGRYFDEYPSFKTGRGMKLPLVNGLGVVLNDGPQKMVQVYLPDVKGQFTGRSETAWVRLDEVKVNNKSIQLDGFTDQSLGERVRKITFDKDSKIIVLENWQAGQKIKISGYGDDDIYFRDGSRLAKVPASGVITSAINQPLEITYKKGGVIYINS